MTKASTMTPPAAAGAGPSTTRPPLVQVGDTVLVLIDPGVRRPMLVGAITEGRCSGLIVCEPEDRTAWAIRGTFGQGQDPAIIYGQPERFTPYVYGKLLAYGTEVGQWIPRPTHLPGA